MQEENLFTHISAQELLLAADSELPAERIAEVQSHLASCEECRARLRQIDETSIAFASAYRSAADANLPDPAPARRVLRESISRSQPSRWSLSRLGLGEFLPGRQWAYNAAIVVFAALAIALTYRQVWLSNSGKSIAQVDAAPLPRPSLTPGASVAVPTNVCLAAQREDPARIPASEREEVFREYGMDYQQAKHYELDHLITPALGGSDDIQNLWPEPYDSTEWNAHVKDQLENLLHQMVCSGQIDLPTAQHDIASNWIEAYKRYFHTERPLPSAPQPAVTMLWPQPADVRRTS